MIHHQRLIKLVKQLGHFAHIGLEEPDSANKVT
jgi:hypothetical protein